MKIRQRYTKNHFKNLTMNQTTTAFNKKFTEKQWYENFLAMLIISLAPIGQMGIDILVPSLPIMAAEFSVDRHVIQLSVTLYLAAFACGQIVYGALSDSYGRRPTLISGLLIFLLGTVVSLFATTAQLFIIGRMIQGAGITAASVIMRAMATDRFHGPRLAQVLTYMVIGWGAGPIIAPAIGAAFQTSLGWRYSLNFLLGYAILLLAFVGLMMSETNPRLISFSWKSVLKRVIEIYSSRRFNLIFLAMGACYGTLLSFNLAGPFIVQNSMGLSAKVFGSVALAMGAAYFLGVYSNRLLPKSISQTRKFSIASSLALTAAVIQVIAGWCFHLNLWALVLPFSFVVLFSGVMYPNLMSLGVSAFPHMAGTASALLGFSLMLIAAIVMGISTLLNVTSLLPFAEMTLVLMSIVFVLIRLIRP
jgi:Bcr/CflA subfamily drug resistance transporter